MIDVWQSLEGLMPVFAIEIEKHVSMCAIILITIVNKFLLCRHNENLVFLIHRIKIFK